jgi:hypothetical protein
MAFPWVVSLYVCVCMYIHIWYLWYVNLKGTPNERTKTLFEPNWGGLPKKHEFYLPRISALKWSARSWLYTLKTKKPVFTIALVYKNSKSCWLVFGHLLNTFHVRASIRRNKAFSKSFIVARAFVHLQGMKLKQLNVKSNQIMRFCCLGLLPHNWDLPGLIVFRASSFFFF